ncbi:activator of apoptosis harakiri [Anolis sagrei]|uniref:activator of apoptosis harakiri n=1 Tax=Anolis sagrei TaxID=38937 RepID=UPI003522877C
MRASPDCPAMCPCAVPSPAAGPPRAPSMRERSLTVTAARLKAIGDELHARVEGQHAEAETGWRRRASGTGLAIPVLLLVAWAWLSRRRSM